MANYLEPEFEARNEYLLFDGGHDVSIVWFVDYADKQTRHVRALLADMGAKISENDMRLALRFAPSAPGSSSDIAARAAIAAAQQNRLEDMHQCLFEAEPNFDQNSVQKYAEQIGLDLEKFQADLYSEETTRKIERDAWSYAHSDVVQTPAVFIDNRPYDGVWDAEDMMEALERPLGYRLRVAGWEFVNWAASAGTVMILATVAALIFSNIGFYNLYTHITEISAGIIVGGWSMIEPLEIWVNDGLMALFFLFVGMEIKREIIDGELSSFQKASMPIFGAIGGMIVPALIYMALNQNSPTTAHGWGIPMATDIAFTLGLLALLGNRVPASLKVFVSALAIADDLGAIVVIAIFYGHGFHLDAFLIATGIFILMLMLNLFKFYNRLPYMILGVFLWYFIFQSGVHATLAGVLTAMAIPSRRKANIRGVAIHTTDIIHRSMAQGHDTLGEEAIARIKRGMMRLRDPGFSLQKHLEIWCNYFILPIFAFVNTGILISGSGFSLGNPADAGAFFGLLIGKPLGIGLAVFLASRLNIGHLARDIGIGQFIGAAILCGIGFTMSIFIASATFDGQALESVKLSILLASSLAALIGMAVVYISARGVEERVYSPHV